MKTSSDYPCAVDYYNWKSKAMTPEAKCNDSRPAFAHKKINANTCRNCPYKRLHEAQFAKLSIGLIA